MNKFTLKRKGNIEYLESELLLSTNEVNHFFSTRKGGVSTGGFESMNLGVYTSDSKGNIESNFDIICSALKMSRNIAYLNQHHGTNVFIVNNSNFHKVVGNDGDAIITKEKNLPIGVFTADCVPILLYDKKEKVAAAIHAGWRGVEGKILTKTLNVMKDKFNSNEENILCAIGPAIGACCFEVSKDVADKFNFVLNAKGSIYVDLLKEVHSEAKGANILDENICVAERCTLCEKELFHSYRGQNGKAGRIGSFIEIV